MSNINSISGKYDLKNINNDELRKITEIFNNNIEEVKEELSSDMTPNNFNFLLINYIEVIGNLSKLDNECKELNHLAKTLYTIIEDITSKATVIDCILVFFNLFRVCEFGMNRLSIEEIKSVINIYYTYENEIDFSIADCFAEFLIDDNFFEEVRNYNYNKHDLSMFFVDAAECCMDDNIFSVYQMKKYVKEILENYKYVGGEKKL